MIHSRSLYVSDSGGIIAIDLEGADSILKGEKVFFELFSHGYESPSSPVILHMIPGQNTTIHLKRLAIYILNIHIRITGSNIYQHTARIGLPVPIEHQGLNGKVLGQDSFIEVLYKDKIFWVWGDTLGLSTFNGAASGATSDLPPKGLDPSIGLNLNYFVDSEGVNKGMFDIDVPGLKWIDWLVVIPDGNNEQLFAKYSIMKSLDIPVERGIAIFNDSREVFTRLTKIDRWLDKTHSCGHPVKISWNGDDYLYIVDRYGFERVRYAINFIANPDCYEYYSREDGKWKPGTAHEEGDWFQIIDIETGKVHSLVPSSVYWNAFRKSWIMLASEHFGGAWFLEADSPTGPWVYGRKILMHQKYDFYNIGQHPLFDSDGGRLIYFEGTYTLGFSGGIAPTPLYEYNQIMYRLNLDDKRLVLPIPVYEIIIDDSHHFILSEEMTRSHLWEKVHSIPFFAFPYSIGSDLIPLKTFPVSFGYSSHYQDIEGDSLVFLYEYCSKEKDECLYTVDPIMYESVYSSSFLAKFTRSTKPVCLVFKSSPETLYQLDYRAK